MPPEIEARLRAAVTELMLALQESGEEGIGVLMSELESQGVELPEYVKMLL